MDTIDFAAYVRDQLEYQVGNPSAWDHYDDRISEIIRKVCNKAREIQGIESI
jgi:hypothetical protein